MIQYVIVGSFVSYYWLRVDRLKYIQTTRKHGMRILSYKPWFSPVLISRTSTCPDCIYMPSLKTTAIMDHVRDYPGQLVGYQIRELARERYHAWGL